MTRETYIALKKAEVEINATLTDRSRRKVLGDVPRELLPELKQRFAEYGPAFPIGKQVVAMIDKMVTTAV